MSSASQPWSSWPQLRGRTVIETYRGRTAIALACRLLRIGPGDEILVPAYNCGTEIDALLASGATVTAYRVSRKCEIDFEHLFSLLSSRTRAVYLIHYFGWEQPMAELRKWCDEHGLLLIEDCALSLFSDGQTGAIGRTGDAAIFSLPKTLGCEHGGLLSLSSLPASGLPQLTPVGWSELSREIRQSAKASAFAALDRVGLYGPLLAVRNRLRQARRMPEIHEPFPDMPAGYYFDPEVDANRSLHPRLRSVAGALSCDEIVRRRRSNYLRLAASLKHIPGVLPLYEQLPDGVCPLSLPLMISNRNACVDAFLARGVAALPWWAGFHRSGVGWRQFGDACWLKRTLLTLPVEAGLDDRHMEYVGTVATDLFRSFCEGGSGDCP